MEKCFFFLFFFYTDGIFLFIYLFLNANSGVRRFHRPSNQIAMALSLNWWHDYCFQMTVGTIRVCLEEPALMETTHSYVNVQKVFNSKTVICISNVLLQ